MFFWGMISAVASCISGYFLSLSGDYDEQLVNWHQWVGISVAVISILIYFSRKRFLFARWQWVFTVLLLLLVTVTGHLGGSLTHGTDYLTQPIKTLSGDSSEMFSQKPIPNIQEAAVYNDIVQPILKHRCYSCHGPAKQKGKLRMDQPELLMKGGKNGEVIVSGKATESELVKRILLPREDEDHMPPKQKPQLNDQQITLLHWWIANGADFNKIVKECNQPEKIKPVLLALQTGNVEKRRLPISHQHLLKREMKPSLKT